MANKAETKAQLKELKTAMDDLQQGFSKMQSTVDHHAKRLDRIEKSTQLVVEHSKELDQAYTHAQETRNFKDLCKDALRPSQKL